MAYVTDYDGAMQLAEGKWRELQPIAIDTKEQTQRIVDDAVEKMSTASAEAKQGIVRQLQLATLKFIDLPLEIQALNATGKSVDNMTAAVDDLSTNVQRLETALNEAFDELDREIVELSAEVRDVVQQFGTQFQNAGDMVEDGRTKWKSYVEAVRDVHDNSITY